MNKNWLIALVLLISFTTLAQTGMVMEQLSLSSKILKGERNYAVYLPPDYTTSERSYPVLYLLHGYTDNHTGWVQYGEVLHIADKAIREGKATPMVIVMPDADTGKVGYTNWPDGKWDYEKFFFEELMPHVEQRFRIRQQKRFRAIAGLSMGGHGTFIYAMHRPELFSAACPLSAWMGPQSIEEIAQMESTMGIEVTEEQVESYLNRYNPLRLVESVEPEQLNSVRWYIDCGDDDFLYEGNSLMHIAMRKRQIAHEYRVRDGAHTWPYWRTALPVVLEFVSEGFHQN